MKRAIHATLLLVFFFSLAGGTILLPSAFCQDVNVHITPPVVRAVTGPATATGDNHSKPFRKDVNLILVPATVTDSMDRLVTGLDKDNFAIYQGKEKESVQALWSEDTPVSVGIILDISGSMNDKILKARQAVTEFLRTANPRDEFFLITFSDRPQLTTRFSRKIENIEDRLILTQPKGRTALLDAVYLALSAMKDARNSRKALLIISDGGDNHSRYTEKEVKSLVEEADVQIFAMGLFDAVATTPEERLGPELLSDITEITGGQSFTVSNLDELPDVAMKIGIALRNEYIIAYKPATKPHDGKWHKIRVKLLPPKGLPPLHVSAKEGFYAPSD
ncbi:MAG: VWA domain-containing protein [Acidobacteriia bacterium]|nr:VWA domain-containing protein [Terriglobia bacterium]